ncbi:radical SAM protein [Enterococcus caccae]|uniref:Radical SAM core domain-containing protein n=1 Tax=Enterococcus caccae ATCC BAA-1240 TaxID=1158612 RepID=R3U9C8_9ENTE|nr:radical SAM protein [Enterococcus caccae]EOL50569.1 hypothetical protein UC7_00342 [Enterococcus caccae ATCC BAA-1240]EOT59215.1 hypothetical protein I580_02247 [Enterococcus caccae ATCC BAA-1240]
MKLVFPEAITIMTTFKCTAACEECCYECNPSRKERLSDDDIISYIDESDKIFPNLKSVYFTGGECFLLGESLISAIQHATQLNLMTRCVTNGYWGRNLKKAVKTAKEASNAGLTEINFSTGDDHQKFVPIQSVINAAIACATNGIRTVVIVEGSTESIFKTKELVENEQIVQFNEATNNPIGIMQNVWIPFHENKTISQSENLYLKNKERREFVGCENIFTNTGIDPYGKIVSCCGLTMETIPELREEHYVHGQLAEIYKKQFMDFVKIWIWVDGPEFILYQSLEWNANLIIDSDIVHPCQACQLIYNDADIQATIKKNYNKVFDEVMIKYYLKSKTIKGGIKNEQVFSAR